MATKKTAEHHEFDPNAAAAEGTGIFGLPFGYEESRVVIIPVPFGATVSYGMGTEKGPAAILKASKQVDLYDEGASKQFWRQGIFLNKADPEIGRLHRLCKKLRKRIERGEKE